MAIVHPFRGWRYAHDRVADLADVSCPPYDVISPAEQQAFHDRSPYNVIRIELGATLPGDDEQKNRYTRARDELARWTGSGVLAREQQPALYLYEQQFGNPRVRRRAILAELKLEPWSTGGVLPHEETMSGPKADRLSLLRTVQANVSPIFGLFADPVRRVGTALEEAASERPAADFVDERGERHLLWVISNTRLVGAIANALVDKTILIADGHHRYETALGFSQTPGAPVGAGSILIGLVADDDPGLCIFPTHRLISSIESDRLAALPGAVAERFTVRPVGMIGDLDEAAIERALAAVGMPAFALAGYLPGQVVILEPKGGWRKLLPGGHSAAWQDLDLVALHHLLIEPLLGIDVDREGEGRVRFSRDVPGALAAVRDGDIQMAAFLNPPTSAIIRGVAAAGERMPHKSTYFYPKLRTGLVIRGIDE